MTPGTPWVQYWLCTARTDSQATHTSMGPGLEWRCPALTSHLTHLGDCCPRACSLCQVFSQLPNHTVYFLVLWPNAFSSKNHWQNTVTSCSLVLHPLVAVSSFNPLLWFLPSSPGCYTLGFPLGVTSLIDSLYICLAVQMGTYTCVPLLELPSI